MSCLSITDCKAIREELTEEALHWWADNEARIVDLTKNEIAAIVQAGTVKFHDERNYSRFVATQYSLAWYHADFESWQAWQRHTTETLRGVARHRAQARILLWDALNRALPAVIRIITAAIGRRLGL